MAAPATPPSEAAAVLVPVKSFARAKLRLAEVLDDATRAALARAMAAQVLGAGGALPAFVVCDDPDVRRWATDLGARVVWTPGLGLNGAVQAGVEHLRGLGVERAVVSHADLPLAHDLTALAQVDGVALVPDRHRDGTNVISVPTGVAFRFSYGAGSFAAHRAEALRLDLEVECLADERLGWDVDVPADLVVPSHLGLPLSVSALLPPAVTSRVVVP